MVPTDRFLSPKPSLSPRPPCPLTPKGAGGTHSAARVGAESFFDASFPFFYFVIPAEAGIHSESFLPCRILTEFLLHMRVTGGRIKYRVFPELTFSSAENGRNLL